MADLTFFNLCSLLCIVLLWVAWHNHALDVSYLIQMILVLTVNPIFAKFYAGPKNVRRLIGTILRTLLDLLVSIPIFLLLVFCLAIYPHTIQWHLMLYHAALLSVLTIGPHPYHSMVNLLLFNGSSKGHQQIDSFMLLNTLLVMFASWFASFAYGLDKTIPAAQYPVASCLGALVGSGAAHFFSITYKLFQRFNTVGVY